MSKPKHINWALFDKEHNYKGGVVTIEGITPTEDGANPKGYKEVQVKRFPQHHETWDQQSGSWKSDRRKRDKEASRVDVMMARLAGELDVPDEATQHWFFLLLQRLGLDTRMTPGLM